LLIKLGKYRSGHPNTNREIRAWPTGMKIKYTTEYIVEAGAKPSNWTTAELYATMKPTFDIKPFSPKRMWIGTLCRKLKRNDLRNRDEYLLF
jgi:hypothetical protein